MENFKSRKQVRDQIKSILDGETINIDCVKIEFPCTFTYCDGMGEPTYTFTIEKKEADTFIDEKGNVWTKQK